MITVYKVKFHEFDDIEHVHLSQSSAEGHLFVADEQFGDAYMVEAEVDELSGQRVEIDGLKVGYQFNRDSMGHRTVKRKVSDIRQEGEQVVGVVIWRERIIKVAHFCAKKWRMVERLGWVD